MEQAWSEHLTPIAFGQAYRGGWVSDSLVHQREQTQGFLEWLHTVYWKSEISWGFEEWLWDVAELRGHSLKCSSE